MSSLVFGDRPATFRRVAVLIGNLPGESAFAAAYHAATRPAATAPDSSTASEPRKRRRATTAEVLSSPLGALFGGARRKPKGGGD